MSPDLVTASSNMKAHWKCSACLHIWRAAVSAKARGKTGCTECAKANGNMPADGIRQKHPTFAAAKHTLQQQWDHDRNRESGIFPDNTTLRSSKLIWWQCYKCPKGRMHSWQAQAANRTSLKKLSGCPCCAGHQLCECNSLETVCPDIAADFDTVKNGVTAAEVTSSTTAEYSWLSDAPGANVLWICALGTQGKSVSLMLSARDNAADSSAYLCVWSFGIVIDLRMACCQLFMTLLFKMLSLERRKAEEGQVSPPVVQALLRAGLAASKLYSAHCL